MTAAASRSREQSRGISPRPRTGGRLSLLGGFRFSAADSVQNLSVGSQRLLAFLALRDRSMTRTAVAGSLWPGVTDDHAYASLRSAISRLVKVAPDAVRVTVHDVRLSEEVTVDVHESQALAHRLLDHGITPSAADLSAAAVSALSVDLLPDWYDDWVVIESEHWHQLRLHALEAVAGLLVADGRFGDATSAALAAVQADPLRESGHAALIRVHLAEGNQSEALREFGRYRALLRAELALEPTAGLRHLIEDSQDPVTPA